ncbi:MAG: ABC transporter ATP-binding protein [Anaerolineae bacterium]
MIGLAAGGWLAALYFVLVAGAYAVFALTTETKPAMGNILFGALTGLGFGILFEGINLVLAAGQPAAVLWPLFGAAIGVVANLRWVDAGGVKRRIRILSEKYKLDVDPDAYIRDLSVGAQQRVEIIKALYRDSGVLILDEPTAVLTPQEADELFDIMRSLTRQGVSIIFITHKLGEVLSIADRIIVMRRGRVVGETTPEHATRASLAEMMVGREVVLRVLKEEARPTQDVLVVQDLVVHDERGHTAVDAGSFAIRSGEIVGIAGVQGNGQSELVEAVTGLRPAQSGRITILDRPLRRADPRAVTTLGVAHIPEDRQRHGLVLSYPVADNMVLADYHRSPFSDGVRLNEEQIEENADALIEQYDIRTPSIFTQASKLSGGNQQKVIVAREIARSPRLLIASQPTRGLDVGSIEFIHNQIVAARDSGAAVLLVSAELDEILSLADRVLVMYRGRVMADLPIDEATREKLGLLMAGVDLHE